MQILETKRLRLRTWTMEDLPAGLEIWTDPEVMKFIDAGEAESPQEVERSIQAGIRHQEKYGCQHWAVAEKESGKIVGACGFNVTGTPQEYELVFHFARSAWGKGYATEAARGCLEYASEKLAPAKIIAGCHPGNFASKQVIQKLGFRFLGNKWFEDTQREEPYFELELFPTRRKSKS